MADTNTYQSRFTLRMTALYFVLTFAITWAILIPALSSVPEESLTPFFVPAAFGPFLAAIVVMGIYRGRSGLIQWLRQVFKIRIPIVLYLAGAFFLPIGIGALHYSLYWVLGGRSDLSAAMPWSYYPINLLLVTLLLGGNEEPGWRGFALPALLEHFHPVPASLILGLFHAAWHLPVMNYYDTTFGWYLFNLIPLTFILNRLYLKSNQSVIPVMLLHSGTNVISNFIPTPGDVLQGLGTWFFLRGIVYWGMAIVLLITTKGRLGYDATYCSNA
ncbi:MAG: CPBP family intramembrane metalloprotease [Candidatus Bathyarchaeota archaeon]|nr:CPBP family intramembrane metalloprotease [Candidatus Bathyarchaeota archaeon]